MWKAVITTRNLTTTVQLKIAQQETFLSFREVIQLWKTEEHFRSFYNELLAQSAYEAFYWEVAPMNSKRLAEPFEFVLIESEPLKRINANPLPFQTHFKTDQSVVSFWNLGRDAKLVVPCPHAAVHHYGHLASFVRSGETAQIDAFWQRIGEEYEQLLGEEVKWLSTAGLGVYWLHIRIDSRPKYYRHQAYKTMVS